LNADAQKLLTAGGKYGGIFPAPNSGGNFTGGNVVPTFLREEIVRVDHNFSDKFTIYGHFVAEQVSHNYGTTLGVVTTPPPSALASAIHRTPRSFIPPTRSARR